MSRRIRGFDGVAPLGAGVIIAMIAVAGMAAYQLRSLSGSPSAAAVDASKRRDSAKAIRMFRDATERHVAQIDGRSMFYLPAAPDIAEDNGPKPTVYGGPSLFAFVNNTAWFSDGQKLSLKQPEARTLKLVKANPPWSVRVSWEGAEFDVELFKKTDIASLQDTARSSMTPSNSSQTAPRSGGPSGGPPSGTKIEPINIRPAAPAMVNPIRPGPGAEPKHAPEPGSEPATETKPTAPPPEPAEPKDPGQPAPSSPPPSEPATPASSEPNQPQQSPPARPAPAPSASSGQAPTLALN